MKARRENDLDVSGHVTTDSSSSDSAPEEGEGPFRRMVVSPPPITTSGGMRSLGSCTMPRRATPRFSAVVVPLALFM